MRKHAATGGPSASASLHGIFSIAVDQDDSLYLSDLSGIRKINAGGFIRSVAGSGLYGNSGDGGLAALANISSPYGAAFDRFGSFYFAQIGEGDSTHYDAVRKVDSGGLISVAAGGTGLHDRDTGLVRFGYRDYDPDTGRWTAKDPIRFAGGDTDLFGYCLNDSVNWVDPSGLARISGIDNNPIYVHQNDADPFPSDPHGHVGSPNSTTKVDVNTGEYYQGTKKTGKKLSKKALKKLRDTLIKRGLLRPCMPPILLLPGMEQALKNHLNGMPLNHVPGQVY
ncbi:MAG: hypothetical protein GY795_02080 [Desulfobacterales bacterium]|nr:hypothetical protein [Desulfobacterales bacterium]